MSKQWVLVGAIVAGIAVGFYALSKLGAQIDRVQVGDRAPDFKALDLATDDTVSLVDRYRGNVTLVNIWATWCIPCKVEMPAMESLYTAYADRGFKIAAVSIDEGSAQPVRDFAQELALTFDILHDRTGQIQQTYQTTGVPESFLLDRDGVIIKRVIGDHAWNSEVNRGLVESLLAERR